MYAAETITAEVMTREEFRKARREQALQEQKAKRKKIFLFFLTLLIMFGVGVGFGTLLAKAEEPKPDDPMHKYYTSIQVESGDTLWDLAELYMDKEHYDTHMDYIYEVININHMMTDRLTAGKKIIVPYYSMEEK